ncbi:outer membrane beta-barrel protein [Acidiferrobacter sp.]|uniref:outer membrane beta-barrel protein n=1 Tax=Acidiferrobacter sp. TaxID=1872107 RepID=UPI002616E112|nr:outer membrane beta-barrel protein [Acidiferrobacter sp.]
MRKMLFAVPVALCGLGLAAPHAHATLNSPTAINFSGGPLGTLSAEGVLSAAGTWQSNPVTLTGPATYGTNRNARLDITNAELILQKTTGLVQFFAMAGSYNFPTLGQAILPTPAIPDYYYGAVPEAYLTLAPTSSFSVEVGKLPTLMGGETTWSWMNQNIERGLLWSSENAVSRGVQANYAVGPVSASLSFNDGYYSGHYNVLTGLVSYAVNKNSTASVFFYHHFGSTIINDTTLNNVYAAPENLDNSDIYNLLYTTKIGALTVSPYLQYIYAPSSATLGAGYGHSDHVFGAAMIANYHFTPMWSTAARAEYETSTGISTDSNAGNNNLLGYGPGAKAWSFTITPTFQDKGFFTRVELSLVRVTNATAAFGSAGTAPNQFRGMVETGLMF